MALREILGAVITCFVAVYLFWLVLPTLETAYTNETSVVNKTSTTMTNLMPITNGFMSMLPLILIVCVGFTIWLYIGRVKGDDYA